MSATMCVQCSSLGFVSEERVADGIAVVVKYRCDRCNFSWQANEHEDGHAALGESDDAHSTDLIAD